MDNWVLLWCKTIITFLVDAKILKLRILIIDGAPCKSKCRKPKEKGVETTKSNPEVRFGYEKWGKECFFGYKSVILCSAEPLIVPLSWQVIPANLQGVNHLIPVISKATWLLEKDKRYELIADSGFDAQYNYDWRKELNIRFTCPLNMSNKLKGPRLKKMEILQK